MKNHISVRREVPVGLKQSIFVDLEGYDPVRLHTSPAVSDKVAREIEEHVREAANEPKENLAARIERLDREWDIDRAVMLVLSVGTSIVLRLGMKRDRRWLRLLSIHLLVPGLHAAVGWSPPAAVLRRLGFRTRREIDAEKYALKTLRGDFRHAA